MSPAPAAIIMSLEAVFAALAGYLVLHQTLSGRAMAGCGLILCGVLIVQLAPMRKDLKGKTQSLQSEASDPQRDNQKHRRAARPCLPRRLARLDPE